MPSILAFFLVDGVLQHQDGVLSVKPEHLERERLEALQQLTASVDAHDFY